jgi:hypothetical protein
VSLADEVLTLSVGADFDTNRTIKLTLDLPEPSTLQ